MYPDLQDLVDRLAADGLDGSTIRNTINPLEPHDLQLHECRHSFSSWLAAAGIPRERRDRYLGHVDLSMDARYTHQLDHQYLEDAVALGDYLRRADTPSRIGTGARTGAQAVERASLSEN
jgi:integrase